MKGRMKKFIKKAVAIICAASMVFTGVVSDLGVMNVVAEESTESTEYRTEWSFRSGSELMGAENGVKITEGTSGTFADLEIDATNNGKFDATRSDWAQVNANTVITIPVAGSCKVTIVAYDQACYTVDGEAADSVTDTFICRGTDNKVTLTYTANSYLGSISVEPYEIVEDTHAGEDEEVEYRTEWSFRSGSELMGAENGVVIQNTTGTFAGLEIDATSGKWDSTRSDWAQANANTVITVPVAGPSKVTVSSYSLGTFTVDGEAADALTDTFICAGTDNKVTITFTANDFIGSISVVSYPTVAEGTTNFLTTNLADATGVVGTNFIDSGSGHGLQSKAANATLVLSLAKKANVTVTTCCFGAGTEGTMTATSGEVTSTEIAESADKNAPVFTVTGADAGDLTLTFASNMYVHNIVVEYVTDEGGEEEEEAYPTQWNFRSGSELMGAENGVAFEGNSGTFAGLEIDATNGKFDSTRSDWAQVGAGTIITIPVAGSSKVTIEGYQKACYTVDGVAAETVTDTFICEGTDNKVVLEYTDSDYIGSITVEPYSVVAAGTTSFGSAAAGTVWDGIVLTNVTYGNSHGIQTGTDATMVLTLAGKANIIVTTCCYGVGAAGSMTAFSGETELEVTTSTVVEESKDAAVLTVLGAPEGTLTLNLASNMYIHNIYVEYPKEVGPRNIDVWDFGGKEEEDTTTYTNNITAEKWLATDIGYRSFPSASYEFGDLTLCPTTKCRLYTNIASMSAINAGSMTIAQNAYSDGYTAVGGYYCNGSGSTSQKMFTISNVQAGDKIVVYAGLHNTADSNFSFAGLGTASAQSELVAATGGEAQKMEFVAEYTGTYRVYECGSSKAFYHRVMRVPGVAVSGTITTTAGEGETEYTGTEHTVKFVNQTNKKVTWANLNEDGTFTATLAPGYTYVAVLVGATGYGFTNESREIVTVDADYLNGKTNVNLVIEPKEMYTYSGKITGFAEGYDISDLAIKMVPPTDSDLLEADVEFDENLNFSVLLEPSVAYTMEIAGVNDYEVTSELVINKEENYTADITVGLKPMYAVTGGFTGLADGVAVSALVFENVEDDYTYTAEVTADGYSINLRDGSYLAKATVDGYSTSTHVVVDGAATSKDLMFVSTAKESLTWVSDIYVGYPDKENNYATVREAVAACAAMNPTSEEQRITVHIAPGTYRGQVVVATPYISFVNDTDEEVLITCYYGIGYQYYSLDATGYYNAENEYDKFEKNGPSDWGATVFVKNSAKAFRAEGITFENSFNRYITDEELADGVEPSGAESIDIERKYGLDVQSKAATERGAAMVVKADKVEFKDCSFLGSQDTLFTGNVSGCDVYFKNCFIEGQTDYIFGDGDVIFDACELSFKGYSANSQGGYITAAKPGSYLFRNCAVTANDSLTVTPGYFGRPWDKDATVKFLNTRLESADLIVDAGWADWNSGQKAANANYAEYNTTDMNGNAVSTTGRVANTVVDEATAATWTMESIYGEWVPAFYEAEDATVAFATAPFVVDNGDINTPYPGHKLTVGYSLGEANDANDASRIEWYRVKEGAEDVLVKTSVATVDKTYKITSDDIGYQIKVVVTPITVSGNTGTAASCTVAEAVRDGYEDPDASGPDAVLGDGVNIFLVGDSTVKDYSAAGLNSGGKDRNEGAWGEYFQKFFNDEKVTVVNYANGGRSTRNFINEGSLDKVAEKIGEGDYMFIQFGHNDCSNANDYLADRYVPLGEPDANGVYPTTAGTKVTTPAALSNMGYGASCYTYDCGGTFKWYLLQYINVAKEVGAIPVLVTPVSRMYYNSDGTIKAHHDSKDEGNGTQVTSNNAYVTAVKQLAEEQDVLLVDGFEITKKLFEDAYTACGSDAYGKQIMHTGDKTHNNKLGGVIEAAAMASAVQNMNLNISYAVKTPAQVLGATTDSKTVFSINNSSVLTAYDITSDYVDRATYWEGVGQDMIDAIGEKAADLAGGSEQEPGGDEKPGDGDDKNTNDGDDKNTNDGDDKNTNDGDDKNTNDGDDKGTGDGNDKGNYEGLKVTLVNPDKEYVYTGSAINPAIIVTFNGEKLVAGVDYSVKYKNNVKHSEGVSANKKPTIIVTGKGNLAGSSSTTFEILKKNIEDADVYKGDIIVAKNSKATPVLIYKNKLLTAKEYKFDESKKKFTDDCVIKVSGNGNFKGTVDISVKVVEKADLKKISVAVGKEKLTYDGTVKEPSITVTYKDKEGTVHTLDRDKDYKIFFNGSTVNAGTVKFTVVGIGEYTGTATKSYKIKPNAVKSGMSVSGINEDGYEFNSKGVTIGDDLVVTYGDLELTEGKDYKITYSGNKKVGKAKYTIKFQGNYKGSKALKGDFTIYAAGLSDTTEGIKIVMPDQLYNGRPNLYKSKPIVDINGVTLKASNYTVEYYTDASLASEYKVSKSNKVELKGDDTYTTVYVKIIGKGNYKPADADKTYATAEYKVYSKDAYTSLAKAKIEFYDEVKEKWTTKGSYAYDGTEQEPQIRVKLNGTEVPADQYEVSYTNNVNKGKATVVINGVGDEYAGSKTAKFSITAKTLKGLTNLWNALFN